MRNQFIAGAALFAALSVQATADVIPYPAAGIVAPATSFSASATGDLTATFYGSSAYYDDKLGVLVNGVAQGGLALDNQLSAVGQSFDFGLVHAGDNIVFELYVNPYTMPTYTVYSDPALNTDSISHAYTSTFSGGIVSGVTLLPGTYLSFEDELLPVSDLDYNDAAFVIQNVTPSPEPASLLLLCAGALSIALGRYRRGRR